MTEKSGKKGLFRSPSVKSDQESSLNRIWAVQIMRDGVRRGRIFVEQDRFLIGRSGENKVVLNHPAVSRIHAVIVRRDKDYFISDHKSENGTQLNGRAIMEEMLRPGDLITIGPFTLKWVSVDPKELKAAKEGK